MFRRFDREDIMTTQIDSYIATHHLLPRFVYFSVHNYNRSEKPIVTDNL